MPERIQVGIGLRDELSPALKKTLSGIGRFGDSARRTFGRINRAVSSLKGAIVGLGAGLAIRGISRSVREIAELDDKIAKLNLRLGLSTKFISELKFAGEQSGVAFKALSIGFQRAIRRFEQFRRTGSGEAAVAFEILGEGIADAVRRGESFEKLLPRLADAFKNLDNEQQAVLAGQKLFDSEGVALVQLLRQGAEGIERLRKEAEKAGVSISASQARAAERFNDAVNLLSTSFAGLRRRVLRPLLPQITESINSMSEFVRTNKSFLEGIRVIGEGALATISAIGLAAKVTVTAIGKLRSALVPEPIREREEFLRQFPRAARFGSTVSGFTGPFESLEGPINLPLIGPVNRPKFEQTTVARSIESAIDQVAELRGEILEFSETLDEPSDRLVTLQGNLRSLAERLTELRFDRNALKDFGQNAANELSRAFERALVEFEKIESTGGEATTDEGAEKIIQAIRDLAQSRSATAVVSGQTAPDFAGLLPLGPRRELLVPTSASPPDTDGDDESPLAETFRRRADLFKNLAFTVVDFSDSIESNMVAALRAVATGSLNAADALNQLGRSIAVDVGSQITRLGIRTLLSAGFGAVAGSLGFKHGGIGRHGAGELILAHDTEAHVPLPDGRSIPVTFTGSDQSSKPTVINVNIQATDPQSFEEQLLRGADSRATDLAALIAGKFQ